MRKTQSPLGSPVLIGAVTVLVVLVAVFIAYNANQGLPFVPTRELKVDIGNGTNLVAGNDVTEGGTRIGLVSQLKPVQLNNGQVVAQLTLQLEKAHGQIPVDSSVSINSRSVLGLKYVSITKGTAARHFGDGATLPLRQTNVPVQLSDIFDSFTPKTRTAVQRSLAGSGDVLAGRGAALNQTIVGLPPLLGNLTPVARYLYQPSTGLARFIDTLNGLMGTVSPLAQTNVRLIADSGTTFAAISRYPRSLESTIARSPSTLSTATRSLTVQQPFLTHFAALGRALNPATAQLKAALPDINPAIEQGTQTLARTPVLNSGLQKVMSGLRRLAQAPGTNFALNAVTSTVHILNPVIRYLGPFVTVCNDWNYWWTFLAGDIDEATTFGYAQRVLLNQANPTQANNVGNQGATGPVNGGSINTPLGGNEFLHAAVYGAAVDSHGNADCETGQRGYARKLNYFDPQGRNLVTDQHTPGNQGPTFTGRARVPRGETFSRNPQTGPQPLFNPSNP